MPEDKHHDLDYLVEQLDWEKNVDPDFKAHNYLEPIVHSGGEGQGYVDKWIVYGTVDGKQLFSARELTVYPGGSATIKDDGAYGLIVVQGSGTIGKLDVDSPIYIRFGEMTKDEVFVTAKRAKEGVTFKNTGRRAVREPPLLRAGRAQDVPKVGDHRKATLRLDGRLWPMPDRLAEEPSEDLGAGSRRSSVPDRDAALGGGRATQPATRRATDYVGRIAVDMIVFDRLGRDSVGRVPSSIGDRLRSSRSFVLAASISGGMRSDVGRASIGDRNRRTLRAERLIIWRPERAEHRGVRRPPRKLDHAPASNIADG